MYKTYHSFPVKYMRKKEFPVIKANFPVRFLVSSEIP